jgi:hypothetical protein
MSGNPTNPSDLKLLPAPDAPPGDATGRPPAPNPAQPMVAVPAAAVTVATTPSRQLVLGQIGELATLAEEYGLEAKRFKRPQELVSAIHARRQMIASLDRDALLDVVQWGRRPVPIGANNEQLAHEVFHVRRMRFDGLSERGLRTLARLRGVECGPDDAVPALVKRLKKQEGFFARLNRKRRAVLGAIVSNMIGEDEKTAAEYQYLPPADAADATGRAATAPGSAAASSVAAANAAANAAGRDRTIKEEIEESGLFGGIASRVKKTADQYINLKLDEIESRIDRKLDEIDRRLAEWRDKEIANRLRILKITLWASVIVAALSLIYSYVQVNFPGVLGKEKPAAGKVEGDGKAK